MCSDQSVSIHTATCTHLSKKTNGWNLLVTSTMLVGQSEHKLHFFSPWPFAHYNKLLNGKTDCNGERQMNCNDGFPVTSEVVIWSLEWQRELILLSFLHAVPFRGGTANQLPPSHPWPILCILNSRPSLTTSVSPPLPLDLTLTTSNLNLQIQRTSNDSNVSVIVAPASGIVKRQPDLLKTTEVWNFHNLGYLRFQSPL